MKIVIVGNYQPDAQQSMLKFAGLMYDELKKHDHDVELLAPRPVLNRRGAGPSGMGKWLGYIDKFVLFPRVLRRAARLADVVHICDHSNAGYTSVLTGVPHVVTCHDVLAIRSALGKVPQNPTGRSGQVLQKYILNGLNRAQTVVCDSENTRAELLEVSTLSAGQTGVVYISQNYPYRPMPLDEARKILAEQDPRLAAALAANAGFILHVGGNQWYKNRMGVLRIYNNVRHAASPAPQLVMAGKSFTAEMREFVHANNLTESVIGAQNCSNEVLRALYSSARLLLFPSLAEGFGWPIIEAQACGCRVVTTGRSSMTEVGGAAAKYIDPLDDNAAAEGTLEVLRESQDEKDARIAAGFENVGRFSTEIMIQSYLDAYGVVLKSAGNERE